MRRLPNPPRCRPWPTASGSIWYSMFSHGYRVSATSTGVFGQLPFLTNCTSFPSCAVSTAPPDSLEVQVGVRLARPWILATESDASAGSAVGGTRVG